MNAGRSRYDMESLSFVTAAVRRLATQWNKDGMPVPRGAWQVLSDLAQMPSEGHEGPREGHRGSPFDLVTDASEPEVVKPQLVDYPTAAKVLGCSTSTVKRRISTGHLTPVRREGHRPKLRLTDLERYAEGAE